jgi:diaminohydroxyphosphoribosylaminopyrimidine deaminase / 5-amino-6-(5-phosphoribosylamino)uracil reductase
MSEGRVAGPAPEGNGEVMASRLEGGPATQAQTAGHSASRPPAAPPSPRDEEYMRLALAEAQRGRGRTSPNPMVGAVAVRGEHVLAVGHHARAGYPHAEQVVVERAGEAIAGAEVFVNLEPCCHQGRTPACAHLLVQVGVRRVVAGVIDPNPLVSGKGIAALRAAGLEVTVPVLEEACRRLNAPFFKYIQQGLPWVTAKYAMTLDGKIASRSGDSRWISGPRSRALAHRLRDEHDAVLVGARTLRCDDPALTTRGVAAGRDPIRVVLDPRGEIAASAQVLTQASDAPTWVACGQEAAGALAARLRAPHEVIALPLSPDGRLPLGALLAALAEREVMTLLVEGGGETLAALANEGLIDRVVAFVAPRLVGGRNAPTPLGGAGVGRIAEGARLEHVQVERLGDDVVIDGLVARPLGEGP